MQIPRALGVQICDWYTPELRGAAEKFAEQSAAANTLVDACAARKAELFAMQSADAAELDFDKFLVGDQSFRSQTVTAIQAVARFAKAYSAWLEAEHYPALRTRVDAAQVSLDKVRKQVRADLEKSGWWAPVDGVVEPRAWTPAMVESNAATHDLRNELASLQSQLHGHAQASACREVLQAATALLERFRDRAVAEATAV